VVLFPAPLWPNKAVIWPSKKFNDKLLTTVRSLKLRDISLIDIPTGKWSGSCSMYLSLFSNFKEK
jgi:hypothetical protein